MMKNVRFVPVLIVLLLAFSSCKETNILKTKTTETKTTKKAPPGQVKKETGSKSAAPYAPGQQKKSTTPPGQKKKD